MTTHQARTPHSIQRYLLGLILLIFPLFAFAIAESSVIADRYYAWCNAIGEAKGNPAVVVKFYAPNALLLPTLSSKILENTQGGLNAYFASLTSHPQIQCKTDKLMTRLYGALAINAGFYTFSYQENGKTKMIPARFTFVYEKFGNQWLIVNHHSSKLP